MARKLTAIFLSFALMLVPMSGSAQIGGDSVTALMLNAVADAVAAQSAAGLANSKAGHDKKPTELAGDVQAAATKMFDVATTMDQVVGQYSIEIADERDNLAEINRRISEAEEGGGTASAELLSDRADSIALIDLFENGQSSWATAATTWRIVGQGWQSGASALAGDQDDPSTLAGQPSNGGSTSGTTGAALGISMSAWSIGTPPVPTSP